MIKDNFYFNCCITLKNNFEVNYSSRFFLNVLFTFVLILVLVFHTLSAAITFSDVSDHAGVDYKAPSFGASWGDFNGDKWPDIWVGNHYKKPSLFLNQTNGTFKNIIDEVWVGKINADAHGAAWADFDNDGDQDLIEQVGASFGSGEGPNHLYVNSEGKLRDMASKLGVDQPLARGRTPLWFDANSDGLLDLVLLNSKRPDGRAPSSIFQQVGDNSFVNASSKFNFHDPSRSRMDKAKDLLKSLMNLQFGLPPVIYGKKRFSLLTDFTGDGGNGVNIFCSNANKQSE